MLYHIFHVNKGKKDREHVNQSAHPPHLSSKNFQWPSQPRSLSDHPSTTMETLTLALSIQFTSIQNLSQLKVLASVQGEEVEDGK